MEKHYLYDGLTLVAETNAIGNTLATYHYGQRRQLAETRNTTNSYYLADALGTNVAITNQDGSIQNRMDYDVWGNLNQETASSESPFGFTGYIRDDEIDLYYANARYYDSFTGRFLREDPLNGDVNTPPSLHRYLYGYANPTAFIDPTGNANDTSHYYEALLIGQLVGLNEGQRLAYAIGAQIADEFSHHDAIENSLNYVISQFLFPLPYEAVVKNNCGNHALCDVRPREVRRAVTDYTMNVAQNYAEIGTADHTNTDSYFHIVKDTLGTDDEYLHSPVIGHLFEWKNTDKSFLYHESKRIKAFKARARLLYMHAVKQGTNKEDEEQFEINLNKMIISLDKQNNKLHEKFKEYRPHGKLFNYQDFIKDVDEFDMMRAQLNQYGISDPNPTESNDLNTNIDAFLMNFSHRQLREIALEIDPKISVHLHRLDKKYLAAFVSAKFDYAQKKSQNFVYNRVIRKNGEGDIVN